MPGPLHALTDDARVSELQAEPRGDIKHDHRTHGGRRPPERSLAAERPIESNIFVLLDIIIASQ